MEVVFEANSISFSPLIYKDIKTTYKLDTSQTSILLAGTGACFNIYLFDGPNAWGVNVVWTSIPYIHLLP